MENWEDIIKGKLEGYESALPEGGLAEFRSRRSPAVAGRKKFAPVIWAASLAAAAAVALFAFPRRDDAPAPDTDKVAEAIAPAPEIIDVTEAVPVVEIPQNPKTTAAARASQPTPGMQAAEPQASQTAPVPTTQESTQKETSAEPQTPSRPQNEGQRSPYNEPSLQPAQQPAVQAPVHKRRSSNLLARTGAFAEKALFTSSGVVAVAGIAAGILGGGGAAFFPESTTESAPPTHHFPMRIGITAGLPVSNTVRLVSGVEYILYPTDINNPNALGTHQLAHFIGVPLRLDWTFASIKRLDLYAGAGIEGNFCVAASISGNRIGKAEPYLTAVGTLGAMYRISPTIGLYLEPVMTFFPTAALQNLQTYGTQSPLTFSVSTGLRFNLF